MPINYDSRAFRSITNSAGGDVGALTTFYYRQSGNVVMGMYTGGAIAQGTLIARVQQDDSLDMRYQHVTIDGEIKTGRCMSRPELLADGRLRLHEQWQWTEGGTDVGESVIEEVLKEEAAPLS
jgi:hypothetical protein